ncbi:hypothetical protein FH972_011955 [Carpinus fangiana]|uniref:Uncharacterized protein n=1 Tax=Carpinus fangiana TaxID=176857 RepID=A0A5N6R5G0_9ROSI|nr:hypothetical protein FH972_011955 [Carpinus fangiana]
MEEEHGGPGHVMRLLRKVVPLYESGNHLEAMLVMDDLIRFHFHYFIDLSDQFGQLFLKNMAFFIDDDEEEYIADMPTAVDKILRNRAPGLRRRVVNHDMPMAVGIAIPGLNLREKIELFGIVEKSGGNPELHGDGETHRRRLTGFGNESGLGLTEVLLRRCRRFGSLSLPQTVTVKLAGVG